MPRGGARPGAGRPKKGQEKPASRPDVDAAADKLAVGDPDVSTPLAFLLSVMGNPLEELKMRVQCASIAAPYMHPRKAEAGAGKKDAQAEKAAKVASGKFAAAAPPKLVVNNKG